MLGGGFAGPIYLVKSQVPAHRRTRASTPSKSCQRHQTSRSSPPPPDTVPGLIAALGKKGTRAAVVITGGLGLELRQRMLDAARPTCLRIVCPNCLGLWGVPALRVNPNFRHGEAEAAQLAFLSQSGALVGGVLDWAESRGIRFSYVVSMGDMAVVDAGDLLDFLAADISTSAILPYRETIPSVRKFMSASRSAARAKPVVVIKSGRSEASARAAATDTGALAGSDAAVVSAFRRAGLVRVEERDSRRRTSASAFLAPRKEISHKTNARFTQIDYGRAMAFVTFREDQSELLGVARLAADPDFCERRIRRDRAQRSEGRRSRPEADAAAHPLCRERRPARFLVLPPMVLAPHRVALKSVMLETPPAAAPLHETFLTPERDARRGRGPGLLSNPLATRRPRSSRLACSASP